MEKPLKTTSRMLRSEEGSMTVLGLFIFMFVAMVGAVALDFGQLYSARTQLQVLADQVGHAAIYQRSLKAEDQAKVDAVALATATAAPSRYGEPIKVTDIKFGTFDNATGVFKETANAKEAVKVIASFTAGRDNAAPSYLFKLIGFASFDIVVESVWQAYYPDCLNEGLVSVGKVDVRSNNSFGAGFCLHSNRHVEMQNGNNFEVGSTVSMPDKSDLVSGGFSSNTGLEDALQDGHMNLRVLSRLETFRTGLLAGDPKVIPSYITDYNPVSVKKQNFDATEFLPGRIYNVSCPGTRVNINASSAPLNRVVIVTDCKVSFSGGSQLQNAVVLTTNTSGNSINSPSGLKVGLNDSCAPGGGATLLTYGSMSFPADLHAYGGRFIARDYIDFSANASGVEGVSMIAGGGISGTSNMNMGVCGGTAETNFQVPYFRMAR